MSTAKYEAHLVIDPVTESPSDSSPSDSVTKFFEFLKLHPKPTIAEIDEYVESTKKSVMIGGITEANLLDKSASQVTSVHRGVPELPSDPVTKSLTLQIIQEDHEYYQELMDNSDMRSWMADRLHLEIGWLLNEKSLRVKNLEERIRYLETELHRVEGLLYGTGQATNQELMKLRRKP